MSYLSFVFEKHQSNESLQDSWSNFTSAHWISHWSFSLKRPSHLACTYTFQAKIWLSSKRAVDIRYQWINLDESFRPYYTAPWRKVVGRSERDNPERYYGWFWVHCSLKNFERKAREAKELCLRMLKESNNRRFNSYSVRNSLLIISHIAFRDCRVHIFSDNLSRNSCIHYEYYVKRF